MDAKVLLNKLTLDDYEKIFYDLGVEEIKKSENYYQLPTLCHNIDLSEASYKLYFYLDTRTFFCFTECQKSRDIFDLIADRWRLMGNNCFTFPMIIQYICNTCGINNDNNCENNIITQPIWKKRIEIYKSRKKSLYLGKRYSKSILRYLSPYHSEAFLNDGISKTTMEKFGIAYYPPNNQITIPVYDLDGELVGIHCRNLDQYKIDKGFKYIPLKTVSGLDYRFKTNEVLYGLNMNAPMIQKHKQIVLLESPKGVLQMDTMYGHDNISVGMFGMNLGKQRRDEILKLGVNEVIIGIDKDYIDIDSEQFNNYVKRVKSIAKLFRGFARCSVLYDDNNLLEFKQSPTDKGKEIYELLYNKRKVVSVI